MTHKRDAAVTSGVPAASTTLPADVEATSDAFAAALDAEQTGIAEPYVRLVPPADEDMGDVVPGHARAVIARPGRRMFDPGDVERTEYRLLARALTNGDIATDHLAAMTLVQLVKFLRAAGVSLPDFPATAGVPDPGQVASGRMVESSSA